MVAVEVQEVVEAEEEEEEEEEEEAAAAAAALLLLPLRQTDAPFRAAAGRRICRPEWRSAPEKSRGSGAGGAA